MGRSKQAAQQSILPELFSLPTGASCIQYFPQHMRPSCSHSHLTLTFLQFDLSVFPLPFPLPFTLTCSRGAPPARLPPFRFLLWPPVVFPVAFPSRVLSFAWLACLISAPVFHWRQASPSSFRRP